jgi:serine/threonine protein kinase
MISDILKGLYFIHSAGIIHRDLKYVEMRRETSGREWNE